MSIGAAFNNAGSGLTAASRLAETVSSNVANAMTEGYARRGLELSSLTLGGFGNGVRVVGTARAENAQITAERRLMGASAGAASTVSTARDRILAAVGEPGNAGSLAARATALETTLLSAAATPSSSMKLGHVVDAAKALVSAINGAAQVAAEIRNDAEAEIGRQVGLLNAVLHDVDALNGKIRLAAQHGLETASLEDERGRAIDRIAEFVPLRTVKREGGEVALYTANGGSLLDGRVWELAFDRSAPVITAAMTGPLNGLLQDRGAGPEPVSAGAAGLMGGGSLGALFEVRDGLAPALTADLDAYASDLVARFGAMPPGALDADGVGIFVDPAGGGVGLSARIALNPLVDPAAPGGEARRLRDGLDAAPGPVGFGDYLQAMADAMTVRQNPGGMLATAAAATSAGLAAEIGAYLGAQAARADDTRAYLVGQSAILTEREGGVVGVDTDSELQFLMLVEQAYAANARVLTVVDSLLKQLLEI